MLTTTLSTALSVLVCLGESLQCSNNDISFDWTGSSISAEGATSGASGTTGAWQSPFSTEQCDQSICSAYEYDIDVDVTVNNFKGVPLWDWTWTGKYNLDASFCGDNIVCNDLAGGNNTCKAVNYAFEQWFPTSCEADNDYDAVTMDYNMTYKYGCCTTDNCNQDYDFETCEYDVEFGNFVSDLFECWNGVRRDLMIYLVCNNSGNDIYEFEGSCRNGDEWLDTDINCTYKLTCSDTFEMILTNFTECACNAASANNYSGLAIPDIMETQWKSYCPNVEMQCLADGEFGLKIKHFYLIWTFYLDIALSSINDTTRSQIISAIASAANVDSSLINIINEEEGDIGNRRRRNRRLLDNDTTGTTVTVSITTSTENDANSLENNLENNGDSEISAQTGIDSTGGSSQISDELTNTIIYNSTMTPINTIDDSDIETTLNWNDIINNTGLYNLLIGDINNTDDDNTIETTIETSGNNNNNNVNSYWTSSYISTNIPGNSNISPDSAGNRCNIMVSVVFGLLLVYLNI